MKLSNEQERVLHGWWQEVTQEREKGSDRAARAILRRAHDITTVTLSQPYQHLFQRLCEAKWNESFPRSNDALAAVAGLLVHVDDDAGEVKLAACMSRCPQASSQPCVSEARFRRFLESPDLDSIFTSLRRALPLMRNGVPAMARANERKGVPVLALANDLLSWARPEQRDEVKKRWAYSYVWPKQTAH